MCMTVYIYHILIACANAILETALIYLDGITEADIAQSDVVPPFVQ